MNFFVVYKVTVASSVLKQAKNECLLASPEIKSYIFDCLYHSFVTEKQIPKVRITQKLALKKYFPVLIIQKQQVNENVQIHKTSLS